MDRNATVQASRLHYEGSSMSRWLVVCLVPICFSLSSRGADVKPPPRYAAAVAALEQWLEKEVALKKLPALSLALVDDQAVVWSRGFGWQDEGHMMRATGDTLYRVGSISKPFTAMLIMLFVEMGLLDLDAPVQDYLPEFQPTNKTGKTITLRQMLSHRSGLVRESPVGNYFDETNPALADTVKSLNKTELVYVPETTTSYSNAALATVGYVLERTQKERFETLMQRKLLDALGMTNSSFDPSPQLRKRIAHSIMWTYQGREFPAPKFDLGMGPAGSLYSSSNDMAQFMKVIFAGGRGPKGQVLKKETLERMWEIQFAKKGDKAGFGLGFFVSEFEGKRRIGHGGAVYGFATTLAALPDDKLGVIVCSAKDVSNSITGRIADTALKHLLAVRADKPLPAIEKTEPVPVELARKLAGRYQATQDKVPLELYQRDGKLWAFPHRSGLKIELRKLGDELIMDDATGWGTKLKIGADGALQGPKLVYQRLADDRPPPSPKKWDGLIGEYGPDHNVLYILERDGQLYTLIEWVFLYPLTQESDNVFKFPDYGLYHGDKLVFKRDAAGQGVEVDAASVLFKRRSLPKPGEQFRITPERPVAELRRAALAAEPPQEKNVFFRKTDLVDVTTLDPSIQLDIRYATKHNFVGEPFYTSAKAFMQRPAAEALVRANKKLEKLGLGLMIYDAYRPWYVTKMFFDATPAKFRGFVADPLQGSRHNRGCAVDITLYDLKSGKAVPMLTDHDEFSDRSFPDYLGETSLQRWHRDTLRNAMEAEGFDVFPLEWWHFDYRDWRQYPIQNTRFEDLKK